MYATMVRGTMGVRASVAGSQSSVTPSMAAALDTTLKVVERTPAKVGVIAWTTVGLNYTERSWKTRFRGGLIISHYG